MVVQIFILGILFNIVLLQYNMDIKLIYYK